MSSLLDKWNEIQSIQSIYNKTIQMSYVKYKMRLDNGNNLRPRSDYTRTLSNRLYYHSAEFEKEEKALKREIRDAYNLSNGNEKRTKYDSKGKRGMFMNLGTYQEQQNELRKYIKADNEFYEEHLPKLYDKYEITQEEYDNQFQLLKRLRKQYEIDKTEQERVKKEEHSKMRQQKKDNNKANRLKKQNDMKIYCEYCHTEYVSRIFKIHLQSVKHKKNADAVADAI